MYDSQPLSMRNCEKSLSAHSKKLGASSPDQPTKCAQTSNQGCHTHNVILVCPMPRWPPCCPRDLSPSFLAGEPRLSPSACEPPDILIVLEDAHSLFFPGIRLNNEGGIVALLIQILPADLETFLDRWVALVQYAVRMQYRVIDATNASTGYVGSNERVNSSSRPEMLHMLL